MQNKITMRDTTFPSLGWLSGERNGNPLQDSFLENAMDRGAWWAVVHGVEQSWTRLKRLSMYACVGEGNGNPLQYSCLENPRDGGAWWAAIYGVTQSRTWLKWFSSSSKQQQNGYRLIDANSLSNGSLRLHFSGHLPCSPRSHQVYIKASHNSSHFSWSHFVLITICNNICLCDYLMSFSLLDCKLSEDRDLAPLICMCISHA